MGKGLGFRAHVGLKRSNPHIPTCVALQCKLDSRKVLCRAYGIELHGL